MKVGEVGRKPPLEFDRKTVFKANSPPSKA